MDRIATRLRQERERQGLTVRDVSVVTKIREPYIEAIERGRYDVLPAVYVRSFVKTLAGSLGIPDNEIKQLMAAVFENDDDAIRLPRFTQETSASSGLEQTVTRATEAMSNTVTKATEAMGSSMRKIRALQPPVFLADRPRFIMMAAMVAALAIVVVFVWLLASGGEDDGQGALATQEELSTEVTVPSVDGQVSQADSMHLTADVSDTCWLTITMDGAHTRQQVLSPGEEYAWMAKTKFVINLSNAGGVRFYRDGEALPLFGKRGETVRSVTVTRTDVISSAAPAGGVANVTVPSGNGAASQQTKPVVKPATPAPKPNVVKQRSTPVIRQRARVVPRQPARSQRTQPKPRTRQATRNMPMITPAPVRPPR